MVNTSKILTVSYGTFSCTLEGFDDSFDTMKAIAEYFRDLAADDRYFGAEPPTPDADMLARIAQREISRRVEAHDADGRIHLRAARDDAADTHASPQRTAPDALPAAAATIPDSAPASPAAAPARTAAEAEQPAPAMDWEESDDWSDSYGSDDRFDIKAPAAPAAPRMSDSESVAAKLRRIRAVAAQDQPSYGDAFYTEDEHAQDFLARTATDLNAALAEDDAAEQAYPEPEQDLSEPAAEDMPAAPIRGATIHDMPAPISAPAEAEMDDDALLAFVQDDVASTDEVEVSAEADEYEDLLDDDYDDILEEDEAPMPLTLTDEDEHPEAEDDADEDDEDDAPLAQDTLAQLLADALGPDSGDMPDKVTAADDTAVAQDAPEDSVAETAPAPAQPDPLSARLVKVKRTEFEAAIFAGTLEELSDDSADTDDDSDDDADLSPEDEAELQRELAEVEAELKTRTPVEPDAPMAGAPDMDIAADEIVAAVQAETAPEKRSGRADLQGADSDAARIFEQTDNALDEPASNERRNAIQHLRAAVAATKAEKHAGGDIHSNVDDQPYRLDLESAVRPRRPHVLGDAPRAERPSTVARPAPLKLVAEQRIDAPQTPVRPRRISRADLMAEAPARPDAAAVTRDDNGTDSFTTFAEEVGANGLPELLEAAAAYMADVEGHQQFSRPMLMQKLKEIDENGFSREDGLRSFGQLLRQGKLLKLKGGRFTVTAVTDFRKAG